jgi:putative endonuclease
MPIGSRRFVYVLKSLLDPERHYVGRTDDMSQRLTAHNNGHASHTAKYRPWSVHVCVEFSTEDVAERFERYLKTGSGRAFARRHFE